MRTVCFDDFKDANETFLDSAALCSTRFNTATYQQNAMARVSCEDSCLYGSPTQYKKLAHGTPMYVIEMNLDTGKIEGIGYIYNKVLQNPPAIYQQEMFNGCNAYIYGGDYHVTREELNQEFPEFVNSLEYKLFRGKGHQKRGIGFTRLSANTYSENVFTEATLAAAIKQVFVTKYF
jgi:hypothetical protein